MHPRLIPDLQVQAFTARLAIVMAVVFALILFARLAHADPDYTTPIPQEKPDKAAIIICRDQSTATNVQVQQIVVHYPSGLVLTFDKDHQHGLPSADASFDYATQSGVETRELGVDCETT
jgi:hypothetical protein